MFDDYLYINIVNTYTTGCPPLKLSKCGFEINSDNDRKIAFSFVQANGVKYSFSGHNKIAGFNWLKYFQQQIQLK